MSHLARLQLSRRALHVAPQRLIITSATNINNKINNNTPFLANNSLCKTSSREISSSGVSFADSLAQMKTDYETEQILAPFLKTRFAVERMHVLRKLSPNPLSVSNLLNFAERTGSEASSNRFLRKELPVRLANMLYELANLPEQLLKQPSAQEIIKNYSLSFSEIVEFEKPSQPEKDYEKFTETLKTVVSRHEQTVETMAHALIEYRLEAGHAKTEELDRQLTRFLDRFFMSRIGIRLLINQHITLFAGYNNRLKPHLLGTFDKQTNIREVIDQAYDSAASLCERNYMAAPDKTITVANNTSLAGESAMEICYVPSHLHYICHELFKNAQRATMENSEKLDIEPEPIDILIGIGPTEVSIRISDKGGGAPFLDSKNWLRYIWSTAPKPEAAPMDRSQNPMAGYGVGLPISRLYARYLSGDLRIQSVEGYGTDACIYLKRDNDDAVEVLPNYVDSIGMDYRKAEKNSKGENSWMGGPSSF